MRVTTMTTHSIAAALSVLAAACGPAVDASGEPGRETGPCVDAQCLGDQLVCLSNLCVDPDATPEATEGGGEGGGEGEGEGEGGTTGATPVSSVSVLLVIDDSGSMAEEQASLALAIGSLVGPLSASGVDWRLGVTTTDNGHPWCLGISAPESGRLRATSCRSRTGEFVFTGSPMLDVTQEACLDLCPTEWSSIDLPVPWIESIGGATNLPVGLDLEVALRCILPQGISGCGFEQPLESARLAMQRATTPDGANNGFLPDDALLAIVIVTDEVDCSHDPQWDSIFLPEGDRVFWSDPAAASPSSAVCWNAGVACTGGPGTYDDCMPADLDVAGMPTDPGAAVMRPISGYVEQFSSRSVFFAAINGVPTGYASGADEIVYADSPDPSFQLAYGIGPGCESAAGSAIPPVRIRTVAEALAPGTRRLHSICNADLGPSLATIADGILAAAGL